MPRSRAILRDKFFIDINAEQEYGIGGETRLARFDTLRGQTDNVRRRFEGALASALEEVPRPRETVAWCHWQLGELSLSAGDYEDAERRYREALAALPDYTVRLPGWHARSPRVATCSPPLPRLSVPSASFLSSRQSPCWATCTTRRGANGRLMRSTRSSSRSPA